MAPTFGYWDIRGLAQPIRYLLAYVGEEFEEVRYSCGPAPTFNMDDWFSKKFTLGLDFPNLPYYIDGDVKITQNLAVHHYLARKYKLDGKTEPEKQRVDLMTYTISDLRDAIVKLAYTPGFDENKVTYLKDLPGKLEPIEKFLGDNPWSAGKEITFVDFIVYEVMAVHLLLEPTSLDKSPKLKALVARFEALPQIKAYMASDKYIQRPINQKMAAFK